MMFSPIPAVTLPHTLRGGRGRKVERAGGGLCTPKISATVLPESQISTSEASNVMDGFIAAGRLPRVR